MISYKTAIFYGKNCQSSKALGINMKKVLILFVLFNMSFVSYGQEPIAESQMRAAFDSYYNEFVEEERHYNETVVDLKTKFSSDQQTKKDKLLSDLRIIYSQLVFGSEAENKAKLTQIRQMREEFNKEQKNERERFKQNIYTKKQNFEDMRLKKKSEYEIMLRKWRSQNQEQKVDQNLDR